MHPWFANHSLSINISPYPPAMSQKSHSPNNLLIKLIPLAVMDTIHLGKKENKNCLSVFFQEGFPIKIQRKANKMFIDSYNT
jgi:hypothetical protein